jgi:hypothetical protein
MCICECVGWVNKDMIEKYGLDTSAAEAWKNNGGGTFSYRDPSGSGGCNITAFIITCYVFANIHFVMKIDSIRKLRRKMMGSIKEAKTIAKLLFKKNPNAYFYRHNEPGEVSN